MSSEGGKCCFIAFFRLISCMACQCYLGVVNKALLAFFYKPRLPFFRRKFLGKHEFSNKYLHNLNSSRPAYLNMMHFVWIEQYIKPCVEQWFFWSWFRLQTNFPSEILAQISSKFKFYFFKGFLCGCTNIKNKRSFMTPNGNSGEVDDSFCGYAWSSKGCLPKVLRFRWKAISFNTTNFITWIKLSRVWSSLITFSIRSRCFCGLWITRKIFSFSFLRKVTEKYTAFWEIFCFQIRKYWPNALIVIFWDPAALELPLPRGDWFPLTFE